MDSFRFQYKTWFTIRVWVVKNSRKMGRSSPPDLTVDQLFRALSREARLILFEPVDSRKSTFLLLEGKMASKLSGKLQPPDVSMMKATRMRHWITLRKGLKLSHVRTRERRERLSTCWKLTGISRQRNLCETFRAKVRHLESRWEKLLK